MGERDRNTDPPRDDCSHTLSPQSGCGAYLGAHHNGKPSFPLLTPGDATVLQAEGAKPSMYIQESMHLTNAASDLVSSHSMSQIIL